jgi:heptosyltransferase-2
VKWIILILFGSKSITVIHWAPNGRKDAIDMSAPKTDCIWYKGDRPCVPHKESERNSCMMLKECAEYITLSGRILLIKLGAAGDVLRTTPLLRKLSMEYPGHKITWITRHPELLISDDNLDVQNFDAGSILWAQRTKFDILINLDKEPAACALLMSVEAYRKVGFGLDKSGNCCAWSVSAIPKFETGLWDDLSKKNKLSYQQEIFDICGYTFEGHEYIMKPCVPAFPNSSSGRIVVGLNTGCGPRWSSRQWPEAYWEALSRKLYAAEYKVVLLGGQAEDAMNRRLSALGHGTYYGHFALEEFQSLVQCCDIVVTTATLGLHVAIGLKKQVVLLNNIFNPAEFELYGRGEIVEPAKKCECYFQPKCTSAHPCIETLTPEMVFKAVENRLWKRVSENDLRNEFDISRALGDEDADVRRTAISHPSATPEHISRALGDKDQYVRRTAIRNPNATPEHISRALGDEDLTVRWYAIRNPSATPEHISRALGDKDAYVRRTAISHPSATPEHISRALGDKDQYVRENAIRHPSATPEHISRALGDEEADVRAYAIRNPNATPEHISRALGDKDRYVRWYAQDVRNRK